MEKENKSTGIDIKRSNNVKIIGCHIEGFDIGINSEESKNVLLYNVKIIVNSKEFHKKVEETINLLNEEKLKNKKFENEIENLTKILKKYKSQNLNYSEWVLEILKLINSIIERTEPISYVLKLGLNQLKSIFESFQKK